MLATDMLVLEGSSILSNAHFPSSSSRSETGGQTQVINNCTYLWPEVSTTIVLPLNFQSKTTKTKCDTMKEWQLSGNILEKDMNALFIHTRLRTELNKPIRCPGTVYHKSLK
jgi:hypothetical protein